MKEFQFTVRHLLILIFGGHVLSHGWSSLPPFHLDLDSRRLLRVLSTSCQTVLLEMEEVEGSPGFLFDPTIP